MNRKLCFLLAAGMALNVNMHGNTLKNIFVRNEPNQIILEFEQAISFEKRYIQDKTQFKLYLHDTAVFNNKLDDLKKISCIKHASVKQKNKKHPCSVLCLTLQQNQQNGINTSFHIECKKHTNGKALVINISQNAPPRLIDSAVIFTTKNTRSPLEQEISIFDACKKKTEELS